MSKRNKPSAILKDTAVFNYVLGEQSQQSQDIFSEKLQSDKLLRDEVAFEKSLRERFSQDAKNSETESVISEENFDQLLARIDSKEESNSLDQQESHRNKTIAEKPQRFNRTIGLAASVLVVSMFAVGLFDHLHEPKFVTLSNLDESQKLDFNSLVESQKLAKIVLNESTSAQAVKEFLAGYQLSPISTSSQNTIIVQSKTTIDPTMLAGWRADQRVSNAQIIQFGKDTH